MGRTYEFCLSKFAVAEVKLAVDFYTPACIVQTLVEVLKPYHGRVKAWADAARENGLKF